MIGQKPPIAVIGNANLDLVGGLLDVWPEHGTETFLTHADSRIGGSAANTALVLQRLGATAGLIASAGDDFIGDMIAEKFGGRLDRMVRTTGSTSITFGILHPGSERTFFSTPGHLDRFSISEVSAGLDDWPLEGAIALLAGSFALPELCSASSGLLEMLRMSGAQAAIDPGWPDGGWTQQNRAIAMDWVARSDLVLINDKELLGMTGGASLESSLDELSAHAGDGSAIVVKCGPMGAVCQKNGERVAAPSPEANIFDTIGAGDAFNAGYLAAWQAGHSTQGCLSAGCTIASQVIREFPRSPSKVPVPRVASAGHR